MAPERRCQFLADVDDLVNGRARSQRPAPRTAESRHYVLFRRDLS
jgi:hypothetical protein